MQAPGVDLAAMIKEADESGPRPPRRPRRAAPPPALPIPLTTLPTPYRVRSAARSFAGDGKVSYEEFVAMLLEQKKRPLKKLLGR